MIKELKEEYAKKLQEMEAKLKIAEDNMMEAYENLKQYLEGDIIKQEEEERRRREQEAARAKERAAHMEKLNIVVSNNRFSCFYVNDFLTDKIFPRNPRCSSVL